MVYILAYINPELSIKQVITINKRKYYVRVEDAESSLEMVKKLAIYNQEYLRIIPVYLT